MKTAASRILYILSTGSIFVVFSELMFWGHYDFARKTLTDLVPTVILYSILAYAFLYVLQSFKVRNLWALFLAGAVYGWLDEGVIVQTMYQDFPLNISFTGLAWHALITVCGGWYLFRASVKKNRPLITAWVSSAAGIIWALWSVWWWVDKGIVTPVYVYTAYALITSLILIGALWISNSISPSALRFTRREGIILAVLFLMYYAFVTVKADLKSLYVLPICLGLAFYALNMNRKTETGNDLIESLTCRVSVWNYIAVLLLPFFSSAVYALLYYLHLRLPTGMVFYFIVTPSGAIMFIASIIMIRKKAYF
ncbi:MAG: hypothetical protein ACYC27_06850, partial [Armatimonadota bacterium]